MDELREVTQLHVEVGDFRAIECGRPFLVLPYPSALRRTPVVTVGETVELVEFDRIGGAMEVTGRRMRLIASHVDPVSNILGAGLVTVVGLVLPVHGHLHAEAYCLMTYAGVPAGKTVRIWNGCDEAAPAEIEWRFVHAAFPDLGMTGPTLRADRLALDAYAPLHVPALDDLVFAPNSYQGSTMIVGLPANLVMVRVTDAYLSWLQAERSLRARHLSERLVRHTAMVR